MTKAIHVRIKGTSPLLMHKFPLVEPDPPLKQRTPEDQAEFAAYRTEDGELYIPGIAIQRCLIAAAVYSKGKGRASLQKPAAACMLISPELVGLGVTEYTVDSRPVVIPSTGGRVVRHRPRLDDWSVEFTLEYDLVLIAETEARKIIDDAGSRVGLLDFRPERKGPFGRFMVVEWRPVP